MILGRRATTLLIFSCAAIGLIATANIATAESLQTWSSTTNYPSALAGLGCTVAWSDSFYCVGGFDSNFNSYDNFYYAPINSATSVGPWTSGPPYPTAVDSASCVADASQTIYCVGGEEDDGQTVLNDVYSDKMLSPTNPSSWVAAATYPQPTAATSCVYSSGYIYCVGGFNSNGDEVSNAYYAPVGTNGLGSWVATTPYPKAVDSESCLVYTGNVIYCIAGEVESGGNPNTPISNVYSAQLSASGIGAWAPDAAYPAALAALSCAVYGGYIYCVGGFDSSGLSSSDVYYTNFNPQSPGWQSATPYPLAIDTESCALVMDWIYCVGGVSSLSSGESNVNSAYVVQLNQGISCCPGTVTTTTPEFPVTLAIPFILVGMLGVIAVGLKRRS